MDFGRGHKLGRLASQFHLHPSASSTLLASNHLDLRLGDHLPCCGPHSTHSKGVVTTPQSFALDPFSAHPSLCFASFQCYHFTAIYSKLLIVESVLLLSISRRNTLLIVIFNRYAQSYDGSSLHHHWCL